MTTHEGPTLHVAQALGFALAVLTATGTAHAIVAPVCSSVGMAVRPGPIAAGQAAIRLFPPRDAGEVDVSQLTFIDADAVEIPVRLESLADGSVFLRASQALDVGEYTLTYRPPCTSDIFDMLATVDAGPPEPAALGELTVAYEAYCPGDTMDTSLGPIARDYPPPILATIALSDDATHYLQFLALDFDDDQDGSWTSGVLPSSLLGIPLVLTRRALCGSSPVDRPPLHTFTAAARIIDGSTLPTLTAEADVVCLDCPDVVPDPSGGAGGTSGGAGGATGGAGGSSASGGSSAGTATGGASAGDSSGSAKPGATPDEEHDGCAVTTHGARGGSAWGAAWALAAAAALRRGRRRVRASYH